MVIKKEKGHVAWRKYQETLPPKRAKKLAGLNLHEEKNRQIVEP